VLWLLTFFFLTLWFFVSRAAMPRLRHIGFREPSLGLCALVLLVPGLNVLFAVYLLIRSAGPVSSVGGRALTPPSSGQPSAAAHVER
jgi:ABC-type maltose transport system permease subunit